VVYRNATLLGYVTHVMSALIKQDKDFKINTTMPLDENLDENLPPKS